MVMKFKKILKVKYMVNKTKFINELEKETQLSTEECLIINDVLENNFIIGKKNKNKIIPCNYCDNCIGVGCVFIREMVSETDRTRSHVKAQ